MKLRGKTIQLLMPLDTALKYCFHEPLSSCSLRLAGIS